MMNNGIMTLQIGSGVDGTLFIQSGQWTESEVGKYGSFTAKRSTSEPLDLTTIRGKKILVKDNLGNQLFYGYVRNVRKSSTMSQYIYTFDVWDIQSQYRNRVCNLAKDSTRSVSSALNELITTYAKDSSIITTDETDKTAICDLGFDERTKLNEAIKKVLAQSAEIPCVWRTVYNESTQKIEHSFVEAFSDNVGTVQDGLKIETGSFEVDMDSIFNEIILMTPSMPRPYPHRQYIWFNKHDMLTGRMGRREIMVPLAVQPINTRIYLKYGQWSSKPSELMEASEMKMMTEVVTGRDGKRLLNVSIDDMLPSYQGAIRSSNIIGTSVFDNLAMRNLSLERTEMNQREAKFISSLFDDSLKCYLAPSPDLEGLVANYGVAYLPTPERLKERLDELKKTFNRELDPELCLGYVIENDVMGVWQQTFRDEDSITFWGGEPEGILSDPTVYTIDTQSMQTFNLYGETLLKKKTQIIEKANMTVVAWINGTRRLTFYPKVGDMIDVKNIIHGDKSDVKITGVQYEIPSPDKMFIKLTSSKESMLGWIPYLLQRLDNQMKHRDNFDGASSKIHLEQEDELVLSDSYDIAITDEDDKGKFNGQPIEELWLQ